MPQIIEITDWQDTALDVYARLTDRQLRLSETAENGLLIAEGVKVIRLALEQGIEPVSLLMERRQTESTAAELLCHPALREVPVYVAERELLARLTGFALTRGVLCAMRRPAVMTAEQVCADARRLAILENITDAANVGAVFRSAAALGVDGVLLSPGCCDPLGRRALRVGMGTEFQLPWARLGDDEAAWQQGLNDLRRQGFVLAALALDRQAHPLGEAGLRSIERLALLLGTEGDGLAAQTVAQCDMSIYIPMSHGVDSLNVAAAGAVAFWQLCADC